MSTFLLYNCIYVISAAFQHKAVSTKQSRVEITRTGYFIISNGDLLIIGLFGLNDVLPSDPIVYLSTAWGGTNQRDAELIV